MRCEKCGRPMKNAEMWQLGGNREAPSSRSMQQLCWDCRSEMGLDEREEREGREPHLEMPVTIPEEHLAGPTA